MTNVTSISPRKYYGMAIQPSDSGCGAAPAARKLLANVQESRIKIKIGSKSVLAYEDQSEIFANMYLQRFHENFEYM